MTQDKTTRTWALFRFIVIGPIWRHPPVPGTLKEGLEQLALKRYRHPINGQPVRFSFSTIERWYYRALGADDPIEALTRRVRSDAGENRAMPAALLVELEKQYGRYQHWSFQLHADNLKALSEHRPELGECPSYPTVRRRMIERGWIRKPSTGPNPTEGRRKAAERLEKHEVRSYESDFVHALWHFDYHECHRKVVDVNGIWHRVYLLGILDDCSRLCCHAQWYLSESAETLYHGLMQAFHKRGLPRGALSDNGSAMLAGETQNGFLRLGVHHDTTLAYSPYQNGKQEVFWAQVEGRLLAMLSHVEPLTLEMLNQATQAWVEQEYNRSHHREIRMPPRQKALQVKAVDRPAPDHQAIRLAFTVRERRIQRRSDGSITVKGVRFEIPSRFRFIKEIYVRYQSWDLSRIFMMDKRNDHLLATLYPQDKSKNADGRRRLLANPALSVDIPKDGSEPLPPLLNKYMAQYAATGLPPAYLPKEDV
jgi:transposase InsO family protein